ncbi:MAG: hypothetical protein U0794_07955 [Isosphaeraceae bacterium]
MRSAALIVVAFTLQAGTALGQVESGPEAGTAPKSFKTFVVVGERPENSVDFIAERAEKSTIYLFIPAGKWSRPVARFVKKLDEALEKGVEGEAEAVSIAVWVTPEPASSKEYLPRAQQSLMFNKTTLSVFEGNAFGPEGWSLNDSADVTAVVVKRGKVVKSLGLISANETVVKDVLDVLTAKK